MKISRLGKCRRAETNTREGKKGDREKERKRERVREEEKQKKRKRKERAGEDVIKFPNVRQ